MQSNGHCAYPAMTYPGLSLGTPICEAKVKRKLEVWGRGRGPREKIAYLHSESLKHTKVFLRWIASSLKIFRKHRNIQRFIKCTEDDISKLKVKTV